MVNFTPLIIVVMAMATTALSAGIWGFVKCRREKENLPCSVGIAIVCWILAFEVMAAVALWSYKIHSWVC